jgi:hypothetical protein
MGTRKRSVHDEPRVLKIREATSEGSRAGQTGRCGEIGVGSICGHTQVLEWFIRYVILITVKR